MNRLAALEQELYGPPDPPPDPKALRLAEAELRRVQRDQRIAAALEALRAAGIGYEAKVGQAQVLIRRGRRTFEFWPSTGKWRERDAALCRGQAAWNRPPRQRGEGTDALIAAVRAAR